MSLNLALALYESFTYLLIYLLTYLLTQVIDFDTKRKLVYIFLLVVNSNLDPTLHSFRDTVA